ncbi:MAG: ceramidase [Gammaproteobacteria bacterium]|nr:ceramidase [Gammaproteobacteria bacterium]
MSIATKQRLLLVVCLIAAIATLLAPRIPQDPDYHLFADHNSLWSIPNTLNVLSNLLFAWIGVEGLYRLLGQKRLQILQQMRIAYVTFFAALIFIALGSIYYHWSPDNRSLAWDRLPMTIAFMSFIAILLAERVSLSVARRLFPLFIIAGVASIAYWHYSELSGNGDLRFYALVQFLPVLITPLILIAFVSRYSRSSDIWWLWIWYLTAKLCEIFDHEIYQWLALLSGHSLKHIGAGIGCLVFLRHLRHRRLRHP